MLDTSIDTYTAARQQAINKLIAPIIKQKQEDAERDGMAAERMRKDFEAQEKVKAFRRKMERNQEILKKLRNDIVLKGEELRMAEEWRLQQELNAIMA